MAATSQLSKIKVSKILKKIKSLALVLDISEKSKIKIKTQITGTISHGVEQTRERER